MMTLLRYLFRRRALKHRLPLLSHRYSSNIGPKPTAAQRPIVDGLKLHGLVRTDQDALRLIVKYPGKNAHEIAALIKPKRRQMSRFGLAWYRFKKLWER